MAKVPKTKFMAKLQLKDGDVVTRTITAISEAQARDKAMTLWKTDYIVKLWKARNQ